MGETRVIYHVDDEETPYSIKIPLEEATLGDFKSALRENHPSSLSFKYFFKSKDDDFGVVKEEIFEDDAVLPLFNGRVVAWLVSTGVNGGVGGSLLELPLERGVGVGETRPPSFRGALIPEDPSESTSQREDDTFDDAESSITSVSQAARERRRLEIERRMRRGYNYNTRHHHRRLVDGTTTTASSVLSSEIESSIYESEDASSLVSSRFTTSTDHTSVSRNALRQRQKKRSRRKGNRLERAGSISSVTDSTLSLNIITVSLNMETVNFLGISIVGQSNKNGNGDCGIYVGSIMKGGAVALDGRIDPGDMILQVNDINFENMSNDDAVRVLREVVQKPGPIKLVIAKCWDPSPKGYFTIPRTEPVRPIDPGAWVAHTAAVRGLEVPGSLASFIDGPREGVFGDLALTPTYSHIILQPPIIGDYPGRAPSVTTLSASSIISSQPETEKFVPPVNEPLSINSGMNTIVRCMSNPDSGLEVRDRMWLKITISKAFIGSDIVDWLYANVVGFSDRREAKKYATQMLKNNFIKHAVNKTTFSEQCYYVFGSAAINDELVGSLATLKLQENDSAPPPPIGGGIWSGPSNPPPTEPPPPLPNNAPPWLPGSSDQSSYNPYPPIYNPAPPPSANYVQLPYGSSENSYSTFQQTRSVSSSGSSQRNGGQTTLVLAGSGSGSDSDPQGDSSTLGSSNVSNKRQQQERLIVNSVPIMNNRLHTRSKENVGIK